LPLIIKKEKKKEPKMKTSAYLPILFAMAIFTGSVTLSYSAEKQTGISKVYTPAAIKSISVEYTGKDYTWTDAQYADQNKPPHPFYIRPNDNHVKVTVRGIGICDLAITYQGGPAHLATYYNFSSGPIVITGGFNYKPGMITYAAIPLPEKYGSDNPCKGEASISFQAVMPINLDSSKEIPRAIQKKPVIPKTQKQMKKFQQLQAPKDAM